MSGLVPWEPRGTMVCAHGNTPRVSFALSPGAELLGWLESTVKATGEAGHSWCQD